MKKKMIAMMALAMTGVMLFAPLSQAAVADTTADAEDDAKGSATGSGEVEGIINKDIFKVVMPTDGDTANFAFILDPQGLIKATSGDTDKKHTETFEDGASLFFKNADGNYSHVSDPLSVTNKSTGDVDVTLTATATNLKSADGAAEAYDISLADSSTFTDAATSMYLGLIAGTDDPVALNAKDGAVVTKTLTAAPEGAYKTIYDTANSKYDYVLDSAFDATKFASLAFKMEGACNTNEEAAWVASAAPGVSVAWTLEKHKVAPSAPEKATFVKGYETKVSGISLGEGSLAAENAKVTYSKSNAKSGEYNPNPLAYAGGTVTIPASNWAGASAGDVRWLKVEFDDAAKTTKYIEVAISTAAAPSAPATATFTKGTDTVVSGISLGSGNLAATNATVTYSKTASKDGEYNPNALTYANGSVTIPGSNWSGANAGDTRWLKVVFDDAAQTTLYIEVAIAV